MKEKTNVLQGTLSLTVLRTLDLLGPPLGYGIAQRVEQVSGDVLKVIKARHVPSY
jgi:PadR family transcriptional regulator PadR